MFECIAIDQQEHRLVTNSTHPLLTAFQSVEKGKVVSAADAVRLIRNSDTVATGGVGDIGFAEQIAIALEELHLSTDQQYLQSVGKPRNLTLVYAAGQGVFCGTQGIHKVQPRVQAGSSSVGGSRGEA